MDRKQARKVLKIKDKSPSKDEIERAHKKQRSNGHKEWCEVLDKARHIMLHPALRMELIPTLPGRFESQSFTSTSIKNNGKTFHKEVIERRGSDHKSSTITNFCVVDNVTGKKTKLTQDEFNKALEKTTQKKTNHKTIKTKEDKPK